MDDFGAFLMVAAIVIVTPGPDTALTIRNALRGGRAGGVYTAIGVAAGQATWAIATSVGVAALLAASEPIFATLKLAGAAYLVFLGAQTLLGVVRSSGRSPGPALADRPAPSVTPQAALRQGVISNLSNPKMAVFFPSLLPQFAPHGDASFSGLLLLGLIFCAMTLVWLAAYSVALAKAGDLLRRPSFRRPLEGFTGTVLIALGLRLAFERR